MLKAVFYEFIKDMEGEVEKPERSEFMKRVEEIGFLPEFVVILTIYIILWVMLCIMYALGF